MERSGTVNHNGTIYFYEVDKQGILWILKDGSKFSVGQVRPLTPADNIEETVHDMLTGAGY